MGSASTNQYRPDYTVTPGEVLDYELELRSMSRSELARRTGLSEKHVFAILRNKGASIITPETAIKLERALGMPAQYWLNLEAHYQETKARLVEEARLERDLEWLKRIPVNDMAKMGWIQKHKDKRKQLDELLRFFGIASVSQWSEMWPTVAVAYRQHRKQEIYPEAVSAWLRQGELQAAKIECKPFSKSGFREALEKVRALTAETDPAHFVPILQKLCAEAGVAAVFVPALPKTGVSGATRWLSPDKALIQLSLRYKSNDHLWFTFFHEAGHILLHGKKELFIEGGGEMDPQKESEADDFASKRLIPSGPYDEFLERPDLSLRAIQEFAREIGVAPGLLVGRLQHDGFLPRNQGNGLKVFYEWQ